MRAKTVRQLRNGGRWGAPAGVRAASFSRSRLAVGGALLTTIVALAATPALAAQNPAPDPFPSRTSTAPTPGAQPSTPAPDPAPSAARGSSSSTTPSSSSAAIQPDAAAPKQTPKPLPAQTSPPAAPAAPPAPSGRVSSPSWTGSPLKGIGKRAALAAAAATSPAASTRGGPLLLSALALLALVLASGSLLHLLARADGLWRKA